MASRTTISKRGSATAPRPSVPIRIKQFLVEAWHELEKVLWPSKHEAIRFTMVVLGVIAMVALFIYICDVVLSQLSDPLFDIGR